MSQSRQSYHLYFLSIKPKKWVIFTNLYTDTSGDTNLLFSPTSSSRGFNFGSASGALAFTSTTTASGSNEGAVASASLGTSTASDSSLSLLWSMLLGSRLKQF